MAQDAGAVCGALSGSGGADSAESGSTGSPERGREEGAQSPGDGAALKNESPNECGASVPGLQRATPVGSPQEGSTPCDTEVNTTRPLQCPGAASTELTKDKPEDATTTGAGSAVSMTGAGSAATTTGAGSAATTTCAGSAATTTCLGSAATTTGAGSAATTTGAGSVATTTFTENQTVVTTKTTTRLTTVVPTKTALDKELEALLGSADPPPHDVLMIQSEHNGTTDIVQADPHVDSSVTDGKGPPQPLRPATTWTSANLREFKHRMANEKHGLLTVRRGEVMTVRVPTHPDGKRLCWEFATDDYDIGFGIYFDWTPVTSTAVTLQVSESSDEEEEEDAESPWHSREGDVERGSACRLRSRYGEIMQVYRRDSHREVQAGNHDYPGEGQYLLKLDNSYSLLRNKTLYFHVYYSS